MKRLVIALVSVFFVLATILTVSYAWFINSGFEEPKISGYSYAAYFASGNGTEEKPYTITNKRHLYNLAWLQFLGNWNEVDKTDGKTLTNQYHFQISPTIKEIDMTGYPLPPIGTETYPFVGVFKGNGCVIKNLEVTNNLTDFGSNHPKSSAVNDTTIGDLNIIGMFGIVGNYKTMYNVSSYVPSVQNFYLDNVTISSKATETLIGLLAGYVAESGNITNVGIYRSGFNFSSAVNHLTGNDFVSKFSLIGDYDSENIGWEDKPTGGGGSGDVIGYGGSVDILSLFRRYQKITSAGWTTPDITVASNVDSAHLINSGAMPLLVNNDLIYVSQDKETLASNETKEEQTLANNIAYISSSSAKMYSKKTLEQILPSDTKVKKSDGSSSTPSSFNDNDEITDINIYKRDSNKTDSIVQVDSNIKQDILAFLNDNKDATSADDRRIYGIRFTGQISNNNPVKVDNLIIAGNNYTTTSYIPAHAIWFVPQEDGLVKLVFGTYKQNAARTPSLYTFSRKSDLDGDGNNPYYASSENAAANNLSYFKAEKVYSYMQNGKKELITKLPDGASESDYTIEYDESWYHELTAQKLYYTEIPVKAGYEYAFGQGSGNGAYVLYMDIGQNSAGSGGTDEPPTYSGNLSSIDFVYTTSGSLETVLEDKSNVLLTVKVATVTTTAIYFKRKVENELDQVLYCITSTGYTITNIGSGTATSVTEADWSSQ